MTRLNRMSMDSDFLVDRGIVIKLLVTFFQRNNSKERIGVAQLGGKGVVRGVLGLYGRLVGGILGGNVADGQTNLASDNQSFADMWVDFLLKETEEREKRGSGQEDTGKPHQGLQGRSPNAAGVGSPVPYHGTSISGIAGPNFVQSDSEFSTVPLTPFDNISRISRLPTKH
ncbi:hypothetical protein OIU76_007961 [Salix suchowensis]|nr:hypothetical protein OIU76_007961 [Salix suchowensis]